MKKLTQEDHKKLNELLQKKQKFIHKALEHIQNMKYEQAAFMVRVESGLELEIQKLLENYIEKEPEVNIQEVQEVQEDER